jgi:DNA-binding transcriptional ArsR family regulator
MWSALGDPTRRRVIDKLVAGGPATASDLARNFPVTRQAIAKHLVVLKSAGLVTSGSAGREVRYEIDETQLARATAQLAAVSDAWELRLQKIRIIAEAIQRESESDMEKETNG